MVYLFKLCCMNRLSVLCYVLGLVKAPLKRSRSTADGADEDSQDQLQELLESGSMDEEQKTDNTTLLRLLEEGEKVCTATTSYSHCLTTAICFHWQSLLFRKCGSLDKALFWSLQLA